MPRVITSTTQQRTAQLKYRAQLRQMGRTVYQGNMTSPLRLPIPVVMTSRRPLRSSSAVIGGARSSSSHSDLSVAPRSAGKRSFATVAAEFDSDQEDRIVPRSAPKSDHNTVVYQYREAHALYDVIGSGIAGTVYSSLDDDTLAYKHVDCREMVDPHGDPNVPSTRFRETDGQFEARIMQHVCREQPPHPNLVRLHRADQLLGGLHVFLVMDRYNGGSLQDLLDERVENKGRLDPYRIMHQSLKALDYLHTRCDIAHCDIKPENIMVCLKTRQIKIVDFSCARELEPPQTTFTPILASGHRECRMVHELEEFSTPLVRAPEHYLRLFHYSELLDRSSKEAQEYSYRELRAMRPRPSQRFPYVASSDVWSLAITVFTMITGKAPAVAGNDLATVQLLIDLFGAPTAQHWPEAQSALRAKGLRWRPPPEWKEGDGPTPPLGYVKLQVRHRQLVEGGHLDEKQARRLTHTIDCLYVLLTQWNPLKRFTARRVLDQFFSKSPQGSDVDAALVSAFAVSSGAMPVAN